MPTLTEDIPDPYDQDADDHEEELESDHGYRVRTFADVGLLTNNRGLVVRGPRGEFQLTIVQVRR